MDTTISNEAYNVVTAATATTTTTINSEKIPFMKNYEISRSTPTIFLLLNLNNGQNRQGQPWSYFCDDVDTALQRLVMTKWILRGFGILIIVADIIFLSAYYWWPDNNNWLNSNSTTVSILTLILVFCNIFFTQLNSVLHYKTSSRVHAACAAAMTTIKRNAAINDKNIAIVLKGAYDINDSVCKVACRTQINTAYITAETRLGGLCTTYVIKRDTIENWYIEVSNEQLRRSSTKASRY